MEAPAFFDVDFDGSRSLQVQLHEYLVRCIYNGRLLPGTKLPASRTLASELGVSRNTILAVIDQLKAEGFLNSQAGKGVYIESKLPVQFKGNKRVSSKVSSELPKLSEFAECINISSCDENSNASLPFTPGIPDLNAFPSKIWSSLQRRHQGRTALMGFSDLQGLPQLRSALVEYLTLSRGVHCDASQVIITQGAQQAISICAQVLVNKGDTVLVENPGYIGARKVFQAMSANIIPVPVTKNGLDISALSRLSVSQKKAARLLYITPTHHYPLGGILSASERFALLQWAESQQVWLIEDDYDSEFHFAHNPIAAMQGMIDNPPVIYVGSFSKTLFPGLRLGYMVVPKLLVNACVSAKNFMCGESPIVDQAVITDFIEEGHFIRHLRRMRALYKEKWFHFESLVNQYLLDTYHPIAASAGMHLALECPGCDDHMLRKAFNQQGYGGSSLSSYYVDGPKRRGLVIGFANTTESQRVDAVKLLRLLGLEQSFE